MPTQPPDAATDFDGFYLASRRRLVLEAYALTGDLSAARSAVRDGFVAASHHWGKVSRLRDPEEWVRPRAWAMAQRRSVARLWHREKGLSTEQKGVLDALHHLPDQQRKVLLLTQLAGLSLTDAGRELGETPARVEAQLAAAVRSFSDRTGTPPAVLVAALGSLAPVVEAAALPRPELIHRGGRQRRRRQALAGVVGLLALTVGAGLFVDRDAMQQPAAAAPSGPEVRPVSEEMLLDLEQVETAAPGEGWQLLSTSDNTTGPGINSVCQATRFADPEGRGALVRKFAAPGTPQRNFVQTVEISNTQPDAAAAYQTTLGWFAGCSEARLQLLSAFRVQGLGEQAEVLKLRVPNKVRRTYVVGLARTGSVTVSTVLETLGGRATPVSSTVSTLTAAVRNLCGADEAGRCPTEVKAAPVLPPPSGESPGSLVAADLPVVGSINRPWVGTKPVPARPNVAATTCDKANFVKAGARTAATRTFLIPQAKLPKRFGITETIGEFRNERAARRFVAGIQAAMARCERRDLGAEVSSELVQDKGYRGSQYALWRLDSEINDKSTVGFWMGVARVGRYVAQVNFTPAGKNDIDEDTFQSLITRARDRLFELPATRR